MLLVLCIIGQCVGLLIDVARCGHELVELPVVAHDGGALWYDGEYGLHLPFDAALFLRLDIVTDSVG